MFLLYWTVSAIRIRAAINISVFILLLKNNHKMSNVSPKMTNALFWPQLKAIQLVAKTFSHSSKETCEANVFLEKLFKPIQLVIHLNCQ